MEWDIVLGIEVHAQLNTKSKLFSGASTHYGALPNSQTCFIDAGLPGVLPVLNQQAVIKAIQFGLAIHAEINDLSVFERKNYFYPDLPKGYQISQFQKPIVGNGQISFNLDDGSQKAVTIIRAHLEEDAGKSLHEMHSNYTGIDLNRAGTPLLEIVTAPCLYSCEEVIKYLKTLHQLVRFLGICDGNMQEGSFRCDINLSLKPKGATALGTRTELKNLNSFRNIEKAIMSETARQRDLLERGEAVIQQTRLYNPDTDSTHAMRSKENENDYRYFPDPDLLPIQITPLQLAEIKKNLPLLPDAIYAQLNQIPLLNDEDINFILSSPEAYSFYKDIKALSKATDKLIINWLKGHYAAALNEQQLTFNTLPISAKTLAQLLDKIQDQSISNHIAKSLFALLWQKEEDVDSLIQRGGYEQVNNDVLEEMVVNIIKEHPQQASEYKAGKEKLLGFFVGLMMKKTKGQENPERITFLIKKHLA